MSRILDVSGRQVVVDDDFELTANMLTILNGYAMFRPKNLHNLIVRPGKGKVTHHINGNKLDNRLANLQEVSPSANSLRVNPKGKLGVVGIYRNPEIKKSRRKAYRADVAYCCFRKQKCFHTLEEAIAWRREQLIALLEKDGVRIEGITHAEET